MKAFFLLLGVFGVLALYGATFQFFNHEQNKLVIRVDNKSGSHIKRPWKAICV
jgi:hypothetical protein